MKRWAQGVGEPPGWFGRFAYAEQFGIEPHHANPPLRWWYRWAAWRTAQAQRDAFRAVNERGLEKATPDQRRLYDALVIPDVRN